METLEIKIIRCPYCGEEIDIMIDRSVALQEYIEDCSVCCRPITLIVDSSSADLSIRAQREDDC